MRSINLDTIKFLQILVGAGEITADELQFCLNNPLPLNSTCGFSTDPHQHFYTLFVSTEKDNRAKVERSKPKEGETRGARIKINIRANDLPKNQAAKTPGQVIPPSPVGTAGLSPEVVQFIASMAAQVQAQASQPQAQQAVVATAPPPQAVAPVVRTPGAVLTPPAQQLSQPKSEFVPAEDETDFSDIKL